MFFTRIAVRLTLVFLAALISSTVVAQSSAKPIRLVIPFAIGGISDIIARIVTDRIALETGHTIVFDYKPGANASIGTDYVAKSKADGFTLLLASITFVTSPSLERDLPWHPIKDFSGVALLTTVPSVMVVNSEIPVATLKEFVELVRRNPNKLNYLNAGMGTSAHLNAELLKIVAGIQLEGVLYKGTAPGIPDLLSNRISVAFLPIPFLGHVKTGKFKPIFVASSTRISQMPDVPTAAEAGYPDAQVISWFALVTPVNTPGDRIGYLNKITNAALSSPDVEKRLEAAGAVSVTPMSPPEVDALIKIETARIAKLVKDAKIQSQ